QDVGASLDGLRNEVGPPRLEALARHHAVLHGEQGQQEQIDDQCLDARRLRTGVDGLGQENAHQKADGVEDCDEECDVGDNSVEKGNELDDTKPCNIRVCGLKL